MYTVDYFIRKFEAIPEERWCVYVTDDGNGRHCAYGHCLHNDAVTPESMALIELFPLNENAAVINNGHSPRYPQPTPKQRILAALHDIKKMQEPEVKPEPAKPKREKIKPSITPDLLAPPIPKETERIDRTETLESVLSDYSKALDTYGKGIDKAIDLVRDIAYDSYKRAREGNHFLTPEFFAGLYKREDIEIMEERFLREQKELNQ